HLFVTSAGFKARFRRLHGRLLQEFCAPRTGSSATAGQAESKPVGFEEELFVNEIAETAATNTMSGKAPSVRYRQAIRNSPASPCRVSRAKQKHYPLRAPRPQMDHHEVAVLRIEQHCISARWFMHERPAARSWPAQSRSVTVRSETVQPALGVFRIAPPVP